MCGPWRELAEQLHDDDKSPLIFVAVGSAGTLAGCTLGLRLFMPEAELIGISVSRKSKPLRQGAATIANAAARLIDAKDDIDPIGITVNDNYYGPRYGVSSPAGNETVLLAAQTEGLILDPIYTGKAMSGLVDLARTGAIDRDRTVIFIHTGGSPGLMAFVEEFRRFAKGNFEF